jgi:hypothetical protein
MVKNAAEQTSNRLTEHLAPYAKPIQLQFLDAKKQPLKNPRLTETKDSTGYFYVQYENQELAGQGMIPVEACIGSGGMDQMITLELYENPANSGRYISNPLALVPGHEMAQKLDSNQVLPIVANLGDNIKVTYHGVNKVVDNYSPGQPTIAVPFTETISAKIPIKKVFEYQTIIITDAKVPFDQEKYDYYQYKMETDLALKGIQAKEADVQAMSLPPGINLDDGLSPREMRRLVRHINQEYPDAAKAKMILLGDHVLIKSRILNRKNFFIKADGLTEDQVETIQGSPYLQNPQDKTTPPSQPILRPVEEALPVAPPVLPIKV